MITSRKRHLIVKQNICKSFGKQYFPVWSAAIFCFLKEKQTRVYFTFQRCSFKKNMARDLDDD